MSRVQTPGLGSVGLRPVASPTNQAYTPEVRRPENGNSLIDLANALSSVNPQLQGMIDRQFQAHVQGSELRATADSEKYQSMKDLHAAVDTGQIAEADNPWYMVKIKQQVAETEAVNLGQQLRNDYYQDPIQHSDSPEAVKAWIDGKTKGVLDGRDVWERSAFTPVLQRQADALVSEHIDRRRVERLQEFEDGLKSTIENDLTAIATSPTATAAPTDHDELGRGQSAPATPTLANTATAIQARMQDAYNHGASWREVNRAALEAVSDTALATEDPGLAEQVLSNIKTTGGNTLLDSPGAKLLVKRVRHEVMAQQAEEESLALRNKARLDKEVADGLITKYKAFDALPSAAQMLADGFTPEQVDHVRSTLAQFDSQDEAVVARQEHAQDRAEKQQTKADQQTVLAKTQEYYNEKDPTKKASIAKVLIGLAGGANGLLDADHILSNIKHNALPESDPSTIHQLQDASLDGSLNPKLFWQLREKLSDEDGDKWFSRTYTAMKADDRGLYGPDLGAHEFANNAAQRYVAIKQAQADVTSSRDWNDSGEALRADAEGKQIADKILRAQTDYMFSDAAKTASREENTKKLREIADSFVPLEIPKPKVEPAVVPAEQQANPLIEGMKTQSPVLATVSHEDLVNYNKVMATPVKPTRVADGSLDSINADAFSNRSLTFQDNLFLHQMRGKIGNGTLGSLLGFSYGREKQAKEFDQDEIKQRARAIKSRKLDEPTVAQAGQRLRLLTQQINAQSGIPSAAQKTEVAKLGYMLQDYANSLKEAGITTEEAKKWGPDSYMHLPVFANLSDLRDNGPAVSKELGLKGVDEREFITRQIDIYNTNLENAAANATERGLLRGQ